MSHEHSPAYAFGAHLAASLFGLQKTALATPSAGKISAVTSVTAPKVPGVGGAASLKSDPTTAGIGNTLTHNGLANDTFSDAQAHTPSKVADAREAALAKHAGILGLVAKAPAAIAKVPALAGKAATMLGGKKGLAQAAASSAASAAGDAAGRAL